MAPRPAHPAPVPSRSASARINGTGDHGCNGKKMTPVAIKVVVCHQALLYAVRLTAALSARFCFISISVDLQQPRFAVRMTLHPGRGAEPRGIIHAAYLHWLDTGRFRELGRQVAQSKAILVFLLQAVVVGLAVAFLVVLFRPDLMPGVAAPGHGPASYADAVDRSARGMPGGPRPWPTTRRVV